MKRVLGVLAVVLIASSCTFAQNKGLLIDDFEGAITGGADGTVDFGSGNASSVVVTGAQDIRNTGNQSLKVVYDAVAGGYMYIARGFGLDAKSAAWLVKTEDIVWKDYKALAFYMYGSNSKTQVAVDLKDNGNEMWRLIITDDFTGWKQIVCPFDTFFARGDWQPDSADKNAQLDFPVKSYQFEPLPKKKGTLYFDTVELLRK